MRLRYFSEIQPLSPRQTLNLTPFIFDCEFADYFDQLCDEINTVEYYYLTEPGGYLMIDKTGSVSRLFVFSSEQLKIEIEALKDCGISSEFIQQLETGDYIPLFRSWAGEIDRDKFTRWEESIIPAHVIEGDETFYSAIIKNKYNSVKTSR